MAETRRFTHYHRKEFQFHDRGIPSNRLADFLNNFPLRPGRPAAMFSPAGTPRVRMFIAAEKREVNAQPDIQPPLPLQRLVR
jgi:hypothetical protein